MLYEYFSDFGKDIISVKKAPKAVPAKKGAGKGAGRAKPEKEQKITLNLSLMREKLEMILPSRLTLSQDRMIDSSGFSPDGADFIAYRKYCRDIVKIMNGYVPCELVHGTFHIVPNLDRASLYDVVGRVVTVKKIDRFTQSGDEEPIVPIPAFVIALDTPAHFTELKNDLINYYMNKSIDHLNEIDIIVILNKGIVVKNWREKRSYIVLETGVDSMLSFFILMNEYLEMERGKELDFRQYTNRDVQYKEY